MRTRIVIIGAGPGGYVAAVRAAQLGAEVTLIEGAEVGGTCLNRGCIPSKVMITTAQLMEKMARAQEFGITLQGPVGVDLARLQARKKAVIQAQAGGILKLLKQHRVRYVQGSGRIKAPGVVTVQPPGGETVELPWDRLILATGTRPATLPQLPFDGEKIISSDQALDLRQVPESVLIVGGGVIGCEFAFILAALGARVTVVEALSRLLPLPSVDKDCSKVLQREMKKRRIGFLVERTVTDVDEIDEGLRVTIGPSPLVAAPGKAGPAATVLEVDQILVCTGRRPNLGVLGGREDPGINFENGWLQADAGLATGAAGIFAIGDLLGPARVMLAHVASAEGLVAAENCMGRSCAMDYSAVPGAIFTAPEIATVGLTETGARAGGADVQADSVLFRTLGKAQVMGEIAGQAKIVSERGSGRILGVHIIGPHATDLIAEGTLAIKSGATVEDLRATIHAHPTLAEIMFETALKATGRALHG